MDNFTGALKKISSLANRFKERATELMTAVTRSKYSAASTDAISKIGISRFLPAKVYYIPPNQTFANEKKILFLFNEILHLKKAFHFSIAVLSQSVSITSFAALTEENVDITRQHGFILFSMFFPCKIKEK